MKIKVHRNQSTTVHGAPFALKVAGVGEVGERSYSHRSQLEIARPAETKNQQMEEKWLLSAVTATLATVSVTNQMGHAAKSSRH